MPGEQKRHVESEKGAME